MITEDTLRYIEAKIDACDNVDLDDVRDLVNEVRRLRAELQSERWIASQRPADDVPRGWTEPVPDYPRKRLTAKSVPDQGAR